jgi:hypothetical protein
MNHIKNDNLAEVVHMRNNYLGIFRDECQTKIGGKHKKVRGLYLCPRNELPLKPEPGTKWYANMQMEQLPAGFESGSRPRVEKDDHFNDIKKKLSGLVREVVTKAKIKLKPNPPPVDNNRKRNRDEEEESNADNSGAKKLAVDTSGAKKLATYSKATEAHLVKLIESLADDLDAKVTLTKGDIATLIQMLEKQCMEKFREAMEAMEAGAENVVILDVNNKDNDLHNVDKSDVIDVDTDSENGDPEQPIEEDATNYCSFYSNRSVTICNQQINLPFSHDMISRLYKSRLKKSAWLANKIKKKCFKVKQYRSSQLGRCYYNSALYQVSCLLML